MTQNNKFENILDLIYLKAYCYQLNQRYQSDGIDGLSYNFLKSTDSILKNSNYTFSGKQLKLFWYLFDITLDVLNPGHRWNQADMNFITLRILVLQ